MQQFEIDLANVEKANLVPEIYDAGIADGIAGIEETTPGMISVSPLES